MRLTDILIIVICALLGYGIVRNLLGPSQIRRGEKPTDRPSPSDQD